MTCPDLDLLLDDGFDVPAETRAHIAACPACSAELASVMALAAGFAEMRTETAPTAVIDAALAEARMAPQTATASSVATRHRPARDRSAIPAAVRGPVWRAAAAAALVAASALLVLWLRPDVESEAIATATPTETPADVARPEAPPEQVAIESTPEPLASPETSAPEAREENVSPMQAPLPTPPRPVPPVSASPRLVPTQPSPPPEAPTLEEPSIRPSPDAIAQATPVLPDSVAAARDGALLAFGLVADAQRAAGRAVAGEMERIGTTLSDAARAPLSLTP